MKKLIAILALIIGVSVIACGPAPEDETYEVSMAVQSGMSQADCDEFCSPCDGVLSLANTMCTCQLNVNTGECIESASASPSTTQAATGVKAPAVGRRGRR